MPTVKRVFYSSKVKSDGTSPIGVRVIHGDRNKYYFLSQSILPEDWDDKQKEVRKSHKNHRGLNLLLENLKVRVEKQLLELEVRGTPLDLKVLTKKVNASSRWISFTEYANEYLDSVYKSGRYNVAHSDRSRVKNVLEFHGKSKLYFHEINVSFLNNFITHLRSKRLSEKTVNNHLLLLRTIFNRAIREELITKDIYPFGGRDKIQIKTYSPPKIGLESFEVQLLENLELEPESELWHARNAFLLSFYFAGIRVGDLVSLKNSNIMGNRIVYQMGKTKHNVYLGISDKAKPLLEYYNAYTKKPQEYILPYLAPADPDDPEDIARKINTAISKLNKKLKKVGKLAGIDKKISMHIARHTFGNIAGDRIPIPMLQKLYGHTSILTTAVYQGNFIHKDTDEALLKVVNFT